MTFADDIELVADAPIEAIVIGAFGWDGYEEERRKSSVPARRGVVLSWDEARPMLDYDYDRGYGAPECDAIYAYTTDSVVYVSQYDGSTSIHRVPRNPVACVPEMPGG